MVVGVSEDFGSPGKKAVNLEPYTINHKLKTLNRLVICTVNVLNSLSSRDPVPANLRFQCYT